MNLDGGHGAEDVNYMVLEAGQWFLPDGTILEVGTVDTAATVGPAIANVWETVSLNSSFATTPVVLSQIQSPGGAPFLKTRMRNQSLSSFDVALEKQESATTASGSQTVGYMAIEPGGGQWGSFNYNADYTPDAVTQSWYLMHPNVSVPDAKLLASLAGYDGADPASLRYRTTGSGNANLWVKVEEDTTTGSEIAHATEKVAYVAIEGGGFLSASAVVISSGSVASQSLSATSMEGSAVSSSQSGIVHLNRLVASLLAHLDKPKSQRLTLKLLNPVLQGL